VVNGWKSETSSQLRARTRDMRKLALILPVLIGATAALPAHSQILPAEFGGWTKGSCAAKQTPQPVAKESGLSAAESCEYASATNRIQVSVQKLHDPSAAYQVYTAGLHPGMMASLVGTNAAVDKDELWMLTGNLVLRVSAQRQASEEDLRTLVKLLDGHVDKTPLPDIRAFLPSSSLIQGTQRYALGPEGYQAAVKSLERDAYTSL